MKRLYPRGQVKPQMIRFARDYARLPFPMALDLDGPVAEHWQTEGTPHCTGRRIAA